MKRATQFYTPDLRVSDDTLREFREAMRKIHTRPLEPISWQLEYNAIWGDIEYKSMPQIKKVVYDIPNGTTIVYFMDDSKEIARVMNGDTFDKEVGVLQCVAKKMYGSRSRFLKDVINKGVVVEKKEKKKKSHYDFRLFDNEYIKSNWFGEMIKENIAITCDTKEEEIELLKMLKSMGVKTQCFSAIHYGKDEFWNIHKGGLRIGSFGDKKRLRFCDVHTK